MLTEVEKLFKSLAKVEVSMVMDTLGDTLAKTEVETLCDRKAGRIENL